MLLSAVVTEIVIVSLLGDVAPASSAAVVASTSAARHRRQLSSASVAEHPAVEGLSEDVPSSRSMLVRAWLRAAAARRRLDENVEDWNERQLKQRHVDDNNNNNDDDDDIYLVRRGAPAWNGDMNLDLLRANSVSPQCITTFIIFILSTTEHEQLQSS